MATVGAGAQQSRYVICFSRQKTARTSSKKTFAGEGAPRVGDTINYTSISVVVIIIVLIIVNIFLLLCLHLIDIQSNGHFL